MAQVGGILHLLEQDAAAALLIDEVLDIGSDGLAENVVAEHDHDLVAVDEALAQAQRFCDPAGLRLIRELQPPQSELIAVAEQRQELACVVAAGHHHDLVDAGRNERLDRIEDHRLVVDR